MKLFAIIFPRGARTLAAALLVALLCLGASGAARAQSGIYSDWHDFGDTFAGPYMDGAGPAYSVTFDGPGNMYGTTELGGTNLDGIVWKILAGTRYYYDIHDFGGIVDNANGSSGPDGIYPDCSITTDSRGNLYGTAFYGGPNNFNPSNNQFGYGMVWEIIANGGYRDLHDFGSIVTNANGNSGPDGTYPHSDVTFDSAGNMYGTTEYGGPNDNDQVNLVGNGMVWEITASGQYVDLHDFGGTTTNADGSSGPDGVYPLSGVTFDSAGNMYGTTYNGGPNGNNPANSQYGDGMVWEITAAGRYIDLHDFGGTITNASGSSGPDGSNPYGAITFDSLGNMYGTTFLGSTPDSKGGYGMVWELTAAGQYKDLHDFGGTVINANGNSGPDGAKPYSAVTLDSQGNLYGTAAADGPHAGVGVGAGILWEITVASQYKDLHDFGGTTTLAAGNNGPDGITPLAGVTLDRAGNLWGTTIAGGPNQYSPSTGSYGLGILWEITNVALPPPTPTPQISPGTESFLGSVQVSITDSVGGADIQYTTDGSNPATSSTAQTYIGPFTISATTTVNAVAYENDYSLSSEALATLTLVPPPTVSTLVLAPSTVIGTGTSIGTVTLSETVPSNVTVTVTSSSTKATIPNPVVVQAGHNSATFTVDTSSVTAATPSTIKAAVGTSLQTAKLTMTPLTLTSLTLVPTSVIGGASSTATLKLSGAAPVDESVTITSSTGAATVTSPVTISAGQSQASFTINTLPVTALTSATIKTTIGSLSKSAVLSIKPLTLTSLTLLPTSVIGGASSTATLKLSGAAPAGASITVTSTNGAATVTSPVSISAGLSSVTFTVNTIPVAVNTIATIKATLGTSAKSAPLTVKAPTITSFSLNPTSAVGGAGTSTLTITLSGNAPAAGLPIKLTSSLPTVITVTNATVLSGTNTVQVTLSPKAVTAQKMVTITGTLNAVSHTATLTVTP